METCKLKKLLELDKIYNPGKRSQTINKETLKDYGLVDDPKYCLPTTKASLEGRDPSKSGGGFKR